MTEVINIPDKFDEKQFENALHLAISEAESTQRKFCKEQGRELTTYYLKERMAQVIADAFIISDRGNRGNMHKIIHEAMKNEITMVKLWYEDETSKEQTYANIAFKAELFEEVANILANRLRQKDTDTPENIIDETRDQLS